LEDWQFNVGYDNQHTRERGGQSDEFRIPALKPDPVPDGPRPV